MVILIQPHLECVQILFIGVNLLLTGVSKGQRKTLTAQYTGA